MALTAFRSVGHDAGKTRERQTTWRLTSQLQMIEARSTELTYVMDALLDLSHIH